MKIYVKSLCCCLSLLAVSIVACSKGPAADDPETPPPPPPEQIVPADSDPMSVRAKFMYDCFSDSFFVAEGSWQFYKEKLFDTNVAYFWHFALAIIMTEDVYEQTDDVKVKDRIDYMLRTFITHNGESWAWNGYNDDLAWAGLALVRGYGITGNELFLQKAIYAYDMIYNRGWDEELGGGIWWSTDKEDKSGLSNNPVSSIASYLYKFTGDAKYLAQAKAIYGWMQTYLFDKQTGAVYENMKADGYVNKNNADNVYNSGAYIEAASLLYRATGEQMYYDDAVKAIDYIIANKTVGGIMSRNIHEGSWQSEFARGMGMFVKEHGLWDKYYDWMKKNADAAWKSRRKDLHLTWNEWTKETEIMDLYSLECVSAVVMMHVVPDSLPE